MSDERFVVAGESYVVLELVARFYAVDLDFLAEAYSLGLFGRGVERSGAVAIASVQLDRVATVVRLHVHQGVNLPGIALFLGEAESV